MSQTQVSAESEVDAQDLTLFQQNMLLVLGDVEGHRKYGLAIKRELEDLYGQEINHGRLYPNLNDLVDQGLVEKGEIDKRTNYYQLTRAGKELLHDDAQRRARIVNGFKEEL